MPTEQEASAATAIRVFSIGKTLKIEPFKIPENHLEIGRAWEEWLEDFEEETAYFEITDVKDKVSALKIYGGLEVKKLARNLPDATPVVGDDDYKKLKRKLNNHFLPKKNKQHARYTFSKQRPEAGESVVNYAARLREKAKDCEFGEQIDDRILEQLIQTIRNNDLIKKSIQKKWNLDRFIEEASQMEDINQQVKDMKDDYKVSRVKQQPKSQPRNGKQGGRRHSSLPNRRPPQRLTGKQEYKKEERSTNSSCNYCGKTGLHPPGRNCPAYGQQCLKCGRFNHYASCCRTGPTPQQEKPKEMHRGQVKKTTEETSSDSDNEYLQQTAQHTLHQVKKIRSGASQDTVLIQIGDIDAHVEPDSGASANVMDEYQFNALKHRSQEIKELKPTRDTLKTLQSDLAVKGEFSTTLRNKNRGTKSKFLVIQGKMDSPPLLSKNTLLELGMLKIDPEGTFKETNELRIKTVKPPADNIEALLSEYSKVFQGIGCFKDKNTSEKIEVKLEMDPEAIPVAQKPRPVPYHLQKPLKNWLEQGVKEEIFEKVPDGEPITWCSPLVVQPKPKYTDVKKEELEAEMIRASIDMRIPNESMKRSRCVQSPKVEDFVYRLHDCKIFTKLDLRQGYHQLALDTTTRQVATFSTPWGNYRPQRLVFGAKSSQDVFDEAMFRIFGDIPHCLNQRDDILLGGRDDAEHTNVLRTVLQRARDHGITFNKEKCQFGKEQIEFFGHVFTKDGLKPSPDKVRAIKECGVPENKEAVRSFLGMAGYLDNFIKNYAAIAAPLYQLTRKETKFQWGKEEEEAFRKIQDGISSERTMAFFDPNRPIILRTEASFNEGLSAALIQKTDRGMQPVHFISRTMTETEKRYSQTEKDALAIKWAKERLRIYLLGAPRFRIVTAHKPLLPLFNKVKAKMPPRVEKWVMEMQDVDYELVYEPGKDEADPLDYLSRHPLPETGDDNTEKIVRWTMNAEHAVVITRIRQETQKDEVMQRLAKRIVKGDWEKHKRDKDIEPYLHVKQELSIAEGLIFREQRIILPAALQRQVVKLGHSLGHLGKTKTKQLLREKYWFPLMNSMIDTAIDQCYECQVATKESREEPIKVTNIPSRPWDTVSIDHSGPYPDGHYNLVLIDKRTRYPVIEPVPSTNFQSNKERLKHIFATYGTPRRVESDNGPPFNSKEFNEFAMQEGFQHHRVTPLHPRANGEAERFMQTLNKTEQIASLQGKDRFERRNAIQDMLISYRSTPHPATGVTPYEAMRGATVRIKLDYIDPETKKSEKDDTIDQRDSEYKQKMKQQREGRKTREGRLLQGDYVLVTQPKKNKWSTPYEPVFYIVYSIQGSRITARRATDGRTICRDASQFKLVNAVINTADEQETKEGAILPPANPEFHRPGSEALRNMLSIDEPAPKETPNMEDADTPPEDQEQTQQIMESDQPNPSRTPPRHQTPSTRPRRDKRRPSYLQDYVLT